jgi:hypothetical protein
MGHIATEADFPLRAWAAAQALIYLTSCIAVIHKEARGTPDHSGRFTEVAAAPVGNRLCISHGELRYR